MTIRLWGPTRFLLRDSASGRGAFLAQPDIVAQCVGLPVWVVDTKGRRLDAGEPYLGVAQSDIYQMLGYAARFGAEDVVLLYPHPDELGPAGELAAYDILPALENGGNQRSGRIRICTLRIVDLVTVPDQLRSPSRGSASPL